MGVMPSPPQHSRIDLAELKSQIGQRIGVERARSYFMYLNRFLSKKLSKQEFDKLCLVTLGRENVSLHNKLVNAVLKNAHQAKVPPAAGHGKDGRKPAMANAGCQPSPSTSSPPPVWSNGDMLPPSPRRVRSGVWDRRIKDRHSPLGPNGRMDATAVLRENGDFVHHDLRRPDQVQHASIAEHSTVVEWKEKPLQSDVIYLQNKDPTDATALQDGAEVKLTEDPNSVRVGVQAPLGIPFYPASVGGDRRPQNLAPGAHNISFNSCSYSGQLCHTHVLKERMDHIAEAQGLGGVTLDCANILNNGLDDYLKRLIRSCIELVGARSVNKPIRQQACKQQLQEKVFNGMWPGNQVHMQLQGDSGLSEGIQHPNKDSLISFLDFRVAMELNAQKLGEDWSLLLEKICLYSYEE